MWAEVEKPNLSLLGVGVVSTLFVEGEKKKKKKRERVLYYRSDPTGCIIFLLLDEIDSCEYSCPISPPLAVCVRQMHDLSPPSGVEKGHRGDC